LAGFNRGGSSPHAFPRVRLWIKSESAPALPNKAQIITRLRTG
jgi:hypothetical protein